MGKVLLLVLLLLALAAAAYADYGIYEIFENNGGTESTYAQEGENYAPLTLHEQIISETAVVIDADTGQILFDKDMHRRMRPASTTKVMTGLLALELGDLDDAIVISHDAIHTLGANAANIWLEVYEEISLEHAVYAIAIRSANDATNGIAEHIAGSLDSFNDLMNERAAAAGALNTTFHNATGMPHDEHYSTAYDLGRIMVAAIDTPRFNYFFTARRVEIPPTNMLEEPRILASRNPMLAGGRLEYPDLLATKTGWTILSQHTLVSAAERDGRRLVCVVLSSPETDDKYIDTKLLFEFGFSAEYDVEGNPVGYIPAAAFDDEILAYTDGYEPANRQEQNENIAYLSDEGDITAIGQILSWGALVFAILLGIGVVVFLSIVIAKRVKAKKQRRRNGGARKSYE